VKVENLRGKERRKRREEEKIEKIEYKRIKP